MCYVVINYLLSKLITFLLKNRRTSVEHSSASPDGYYLIPSIEFVLSIHCLISSFVLEIRFAKYSDIFFPNLRIKFNPCFSSYALIQYSIWMRRLRTIFHSNTLNILQRDHYSHLILSHKGFYNTVFFKPRRATISIHRMVTGSNTADRQKLLC